MILLKHRYPITSYKTPYSWLPGHATVSVASQRIKTNDGSGLDVLKVDGLTQQVATFINGQEELKNFQSLSQRAKTICGYFRKGLYHHRYIMPSGTSEQSNKKIPRNTVSVS